MSTECPGKQFSKIAIGGGIFMLLVGIGTISAATGCHFSFRAIELSTGGDSVAMHSEDAQRGAHESRLCEQPMQIPLVEWEPIRRRGNCLPRCRPARTAVQAGAPHLRKGGGGSPDPGPGPFRLWISLPNHRTTGGLVRHV